MVFPEYTDPHNTEVLADLEKLKYWMPVDWYNGGMEHVTRHMIYSVSGIVSCMISVLSIPGTICKTFRTGTDPDLTAKMSKSKGNVVDPLMLQTNTVHTPALTFSWVTTVHLHHGTRTLSAAANVFLDRVYRILEKVTEENVQP